MTKNRKSGTQKRDFPALTGIRAIAAWCIGIIHNYRYIQYEIPGKFYIECFIRELHIGVNIFFVLSGFLITHNYFESSKKTKAWFKSYFIRRFARIYPLYFLILIVSLLGYDNRDGMTWVLNVTLLKGFFDDYKFTGVGPAWTLTVEETFYFFAPWLFFFLRGFKKQELKSYFIPLLLVYVSGAILLKVGQTINWHGLFGNLTFMYSHTFFGRCLEFMVGVYLARFIQLHREPFPFLEGRSTWIGFGLVILSVAAMGDYSGGTYAAPLESTKNIMIDLGFLSIAIGILIFGLAQEQTWLSKILASPIFVLLGKSSYAYYLIHTGFISTVLSQKSNGDLWLHFILCNLTAICLYLFWENPINQKIRQICKV